MSLFLAHDRLSPGSWVLALVAAIVAVVVWEIVRPPPPPPPGK